MRGIIAASLIWMALATAPAPAQTVQQTESAPAVQQNEPARTLQQTEPAPRVQQTAPEESRRPRPTPTRRMSDGSARDSRNTFGFSLGVMGFYDSNVYGSVPKQGDDAVMFMPRIFANAGGRRSMFHFDYQYTYRLYPDRNDLNAQNHDGGLEYTWQASRRTRFSLVDHATYGPNDILSLTSGGFIPSIGNQSPDQQVFFNREKILRNSFGGLLSYQSSRHNRLEASAYSELYRYDQRTDQNTGSIRARVMDEYQFSRQWWFSGEVSNDWVNSENDIRNGTILRYLGGLSFRPSRRWEITGKAGGQTVDQDSGGGTGGTYDASVSCTSDTNLLSLTYSRRYTYQLGLVGLNLSDTAQALFDQRLATRLTLHLLGRYYRTQRASDYGNIETVGGSLGFDYAMGSHIVASAFGHYLYQRQRSASVSVEDLNIDRFIVYGGLYYVFPGVRKERRGGRISPMP